MSTVQQSLRVVAFRSPCANHPESLASMHAGGSASIPIGFRANRARSHAHARSHRFGPICSQQQHPFKFSTFKLARTVRLSAATIRVRAALLLHTQMRRPASFRATCQQQAAMCAAFVRIGARAHSHIICECVCMQV